MNDVYYVPYFLIIKYDPLSDVDKILCDELPRVFFDRIKAYFFRSKIYNQDNNEAFTDGLYEIFLE